MRILTGLLAVLALVLTGCGAAGSTAPAAHRAAQAAETTATTATAATATTTTATTAVPRFDHVIVLMLENEDEEEAFDPGAPTHYLSQTLPGQGALVANFYGIGHHSLDNYIALISGQAPNRATQADCPTLSPDRGRMLSTGQFKGTGCVYPAAVPTIAEQLEGKGLTWGEYAQDMGTPCLHPAYGGRDVYAKATAASQYATRHNPWVYFRSVKAADCARHDVDLSRLGAALKHPASFPNVAMITPDLCNDGHDATCADGTSAGGMTQVDRFLRRWVPRITGSATYRQGRTMLVVTFDEAENDVSSACCGEKPGPNVSKPGILGPGGGKIGAVVISPHTKPGTFPWHSYNHYGLLATIEKNFRLPRLGFAKGARTFGADVFDK